jgi:hypothetical protein
MNLILLKHYYFLPEAELAKSRLETNGIKSLLQKEGIPGASSTLSQGANLFINKN